MAKRRSFLRQKGYVAVVAWAKGLSGSCCLGKRGYVAVVS